MPPKPKFTREELILASLAIVGEQGTEALTARELAKRLGCSTRPIFTVFDDMDELKQEVRKVVAVQVEKICSHAMMESGDFAQAVVQAVLFAKREPNLYKLVFMTGGNEQKSFTDLLQSAEVTEGDYVRFIQETYGLDEGAARTVFYHMWVHCLGMGVLCATQRYLFSEEELVRLVHLDLEAICAYLKQGGSVGRSFSDSEGTA